ncbi:hypothetical protein C8R43DRAFT_509308 [Mycena crocata]|nr:hypothetical protein C8R43DRAFT_509308 [Mycena crocata]
MLLINTQLVLGILANRAYSQSPNVTWMSPLATDIFGPDTTMILAKWTSQDTVDSPSFKLCMASTSDLQRRFVRTSKDSRRQFVGERRSSSEDSGGCGTTVWPVISQTAGVFMAPVAVTKVPSDGMFYLQMEDSSGNKMHSPTFSLSPVGMSTSHSSPDVSEPVPGIEPQAQAPLSAIPPIVPQTSPLYPSSLSTLAAPTSTSTVNRASATTAPIDPNVLSAKSAPPPVAYAAPLSAVAAIIIVAGGLFLKHRRKHGAQQRIKDAENLSRTSTFNSYKSHGRSEVGHALNVLSRHHGYNRNPPAPLFMPPDYGTTKQDQERNPPPNAFPYPAYAQWDPPALDYAHHRDPPVTRTDTPRSVSSSVQSPKHARPRLPPIASTGSFMSANDPATHNVLADYLLPSPPLSSSTSTPRCLLPAPQKLHLRHDGTGERYGMGSGNPLGTPDKERSEFKLYARVQNQLDMYNRWNPA